MARPCPPTQVGKSGAALRGMPASPGKVILGAPKRFTIISAAGLSPSFRRHQGRPVSQYLLETLSETHEGCAIDDVVIDAEVQMDDVAFDRLPVVENQLFLDGADRQRQCHRGDRHADRGA
jgi:hypothetical protein